MRETEVLLIVAEIGSLAYPSVETFSGVGEILSLCKALGVLATGSQRRAAECIRME